MPYSTNADIPASVRNVLPEKAQTIWRKAFNAALEKGYSEERCARIAWAAVKNAGYRKTDGQWRRTAMMIYLSDAEGHQVTYKPTQDGTYMVHGLPLIQVGTWNDKEFNREDLQQMAVNFATMQQEEAFEAGLWPKHNWDHQGNVVAQDADEVLGWYRRLYVDDDVLKGDVEVFEEQTARDMERGKLRYISAEIGRHDQLGRVITGAAFVPDPAVKGMPWHMVINSAEYGHSDSANEPDTTNRGGDNDMTLIQRIKGLFSALQSGDEEALEKGLEELDELDESAGDAPDDGAQDGGDEPPDAAGDGDDPDMYARKMEQLRKANEDLEKRLALQEKATKEAQDRARRDRAEALVDRWVNAGYLPPAARQEALVMAVDALEAEKPVTILSEDGEKAERSRIEVLEQIFKASAPSEVLAEGQALSWIGSDNPDDEDAEAERAAGREMAAVLSNKKPESDGNDGDE